MHFLLLNAEPWRDFKFVALEFYVDILRSRYQGSEPIYIQDFAREMLCPFTYYEKY